MSVLEREDKERDAAFAKALHGKSAQSRGGLSAMRAKGADAQQEALSEYFKVETHAWTRIGESSDNSSIGTGRRILQKKKRRRREKQEGILRVSYLLGLLKPF